MALGVDTLDQPSIETVTRIAGTALDAAEQSILQGDAHKGLEKLISMLFDLSCGTSPQVWRFIADDLCLKHTILTLLLKDPITRRSYDKPRGYSGDAVLLDLIYGVHQTETPTAELDPIGEAVRRFTFSSHCGHSVRARRHLLAEYIDRSASRVSGPRILSVASGHLRELELSQAARFKSIGRMVAFDQDVESLRQIHSDYGVAVDCHHGSVRSLIGQQQDLGTFDLIYAAGLFDYLPQKAAEMLTYRLFEMLRPEGELLVANFALGIKETSYLDSFMKWHLIYRTRDEMHRLTRAVDSSTIAESCVFADHLGYIFYKIVKKN